MKRYAGQLYKQQDSTEYVLKTIHAHTQSNQKNIKRIAGEIIGSIVASVGTGVAILSYQIQCLERSKSK